MKIIPVFLIAFLLCVIFAVLLLPLLRKMKASQVILHYVKEHSGKAGVPTMGGVIFLLAIAIAFSVYSSEYARYAGLAVVIMAAYGVTGFLDDFIKIKVKRNLGLRAYQKILFQLLVAGIASYFVYANGLTVLSVPFTGGEADFGVWVVPLTAFVFLAVTNSVNLTDGLDGLAGGTSLVCFTVLATLLYIKAGLFDVSGSTFLSEEYTNLLLLSVSGAAAMVGFLCVNAYPAKVFMGDTGSLGLGGLLASIAVFSGYTLYLPFIGVMFAVSAVSVIAQVFSFKVFGRRVIRMAPFHHHLQQKGHHEVKITVYYMVITLIVSLAVLFMTFGI
jgi:phospho-N-acetylmuramoyl-pentapeptide-transferase